MSTICANCGGVDIEYDAARGDAVCVQCGSVLEDNIIVSEVSFQEQTSGATSVIGQFVSSEGQNTPLSGSGFHHGMGKGSREVTLMHARKRISTLGNLMKLNQHCIDSAFTYFKLALNLNLTRGRRAGLIDTACLYLVCRTEGTPHLLLDFSDVLQMNVYALGRAFLRLTNTLHINPPAIDPCLYIHRFAHKLELGDKEHEVSKTALRLVARMKRDWLHHGRRPTGLCGAALLIAARLHNFSRTVKEIAKVVKINESTIRKRLTDFKDTPSSRLTIEEFLQINLEQEHDPPSYSEARKKPKIATASELDQEEEPSTSEEAAGLSIPFDSSDTNGGISLQPVEATIAKAQATEQFQRKILPSLGLGTDLESLAKYANDIANESTDKEGDLDLAEVDDDEIESMLLNPEEVNLKSKIWFEENGDYLKEQEERREKLQAEKAAQGEKKKRGYKRRRPFNQHVTANSAGEAIQQMLVEKKISSKINYDVLRELSDDNPVQDSKEQSSSTSFTTNAPTIQSSSLSRKRTFSLVDSSSGGSSSSSNSNKITSPGNYSSPKSSRLPSLKAPQGGFISSLVKQTPLQPEPEPEKEDEPTLPTVEVVEETGPIDYAEDGDDGDLDANLDEDDMTYPGDPLYLSDYEEANYDDDGDDVY